MKIKSDVDKISQNTPAIAFKTREVVQCQWYNTTSTFYYQPISLASLVVSPALKSIKNWAGPSEGYNLLQPNKAGADN